MIYGEGRRGQRWGGLAIQGSGCLLLNVKGTFIGMSESRRGIISGAETATNVPRQSKDNQVRETGLSPLLSLYVVMLHTSAVLINKSYNFRT